MLWTQFHYLKDPLPLAPVGVPDSYSTSRQALRLALAQATGKMPSWEEIKLQDFQELPHFPQYLTSLAHTGALGLAALVPCHLFQGVGVDVELEERPVQEGAKRHFMNGQEDWQGSLLKAWVAKEASFKCLWRLRSQWLPTERLSEGFFLKDINLSSQGENQFTFAPLTRPDLQGEGRLWQERVEGKNYLCALSLVKSGGEKTANQLDVFNH